ncbi:MAG: WD40 repeat domain-containing protein [Gemmataceae bacterium]|nr:WD40 repeat domain-containing protein [Gemmataceae bacterium]
MGVLLYFALPDQPLWTLDVDQEACGFTYDGAYFFTVVPSRAGKHEEYGPIRLRDSRTGTVVQSFFAAEDHLERLTISDDRRSCAAVVVPDQVRVIDFQERRSWSLAAPQVNADYDLHFAPDGKMLHVRAAHVKLPERNFLFELPSGELFANPVSIRYAQFSPDGRYLVCRKEDGMHLWDSQTRREVGKYLECDEHFRFSPDGRRLLTTVEPDEKAPFRPVLWDLATHKRIAELPVEMLPDLNYRYVLAAFSHDGRWLVTWQEHQQDGRTLEVWDSATGKRLARHDLDLNRRRSLVHAPDSASLAVIEWSAMDPSGRTWPFDLTMLDMPSGKVRWQRQFTPEKPQLQWTGLNNAPGMSQRDFRFSPEGDVLSMFNPTRAEWTFLDVATGVTQKSVRMIDAGTTIAALTNPAGSTDGRRWLTRALIYESSTLIPAWIRRWFGRYGDYFDLTMLHDDRGQERMRLKINGRAESFLSPDGEFVLTDTFPDSEDIHSNRIQAWRTPPGRPWLSIVGVPLAVGVGLLMLRGWWRWRGKARGVDGSPARN